MRVCHVTNGLPGLHHEAGGAEHVALRMIELTAESGHEVAVCCRATDMEREFPWRVQPLTTLLDRTQGQTQARLRSLCQLYNPFVREQAHGFARFVDEWQPDLIHFHKFDRLGMGLVRAALARQLPTVWSVYDYWAFCPNEMLVNREGAYCRRGQGLHCSECLQLPPRFRSLRKLMLRRRKRRLLGPLQQVDLVLTLSQASAEVAAEHGIASDRIQVLRQPYPVSQVAAADPAQVDPHLIVFAGWLIPKKGIHVLLAAMRQVLTALPEARLHVLGMPGTPEDEERIREALRDPVLAAAVTVQGKVSHEELLGWLRKAAVVAIPEQWHNMSPVIMVEAMAVGRPVVATRAGGIPEFMDEAKTGLLFDMTREDALAAALVEVLSDPDRGGRMGTAARERALELFDTPVIRDRCEHLYQNLLRDRPTS